MPTYEFHCQACKKNFELVISFADYDRKKGRYKCPKCGSSNVVQRISVFSVKTSKKS